jgi:hypothetical protein
MPCRGRAPAIPRRRTSGFTIAQNRSPMRSGCRGFWRTFRRRKNGSDGHKATVDRFTFGETFRRSCPFSAGRKKRVTGASKGQSGPWCLLSFPATLQGAWRPGLDTLPPPVSRT